MERVMGIEPTLSAWEAEVLPLNYTRLKFIACLDYRENLGSKQLATLYIRFLLEKLALKQPFL
ncbi:protein of unknown function [Candidatus Nitrosacidococcus tergens]|uniref:Uncharacterized protein n=1 Tax=Candidatus Nitrosacidococcus tergens TaxID=553981 RepID=A0A7G1Q9W7_9GAMM|nr:protein of unknown function [Candidatus Nitrosacidococcus tergens]